ncbi:MAG: hypothetical protein DI539_15005 [Flavobacterium psychrophilum]|nr:MAG: hypothetical protein DI539_15005 [Flavobacterium psychrophilum]
MLSAQDAVIFSNDKYSGISTVGFSPTQSFFNPNSWDVNIVAVDVFLQNDYTYITNQSIIGLAGADITSVSLRDKIMGVSGSNLQDYYNKDNGGYHFSSDVLGPSFSFTTDIGQRKFVIGFFTRLRTQGSAIDIDNYSKFDNTNIDAINVYNFSPFKTNFMNWGEIGLNVATQLVDKKEYRLVLGGNLKYEMGYDAMNVNSRSTANIVRTVDSNYGTDGVIANYNIVASYATGYDSENERYRLKPTGKGFGADMGLAFVKWNYRMEDYDYKMSFNILDVGYINFDGQNHLFRGRPVDINSLSGRRISSPEDLMHILSEEAYGDPDASLVGTKFSIGLPTSMHFNVSKRIRDNHYLNFDIVQRTPVFKNSLKRANIANVSYSIQKKILGYGISTSLYEFRDLQFGTYLRLGPLIIGSENFLPLFFKQKKLHSADFYIGLKVYPFGEKNPDKVRRSNCRC